MEIKKILVVEDDNFLRTLYRDLLKAEGFAVEVAIDGEDGYNKIKNDGWDLILLDIILPKLDGLAIINKLKNDNPEVLKQKIVFLTNFDQSDTINQLKQTGFPYLIKSELNPDEFINKIKTSLV